MDQSAASFETERLLIRRCQPRDAETLTALMTPEISAWVAIWPPPLTLHLTQQILSDAIAATRAGTAFAAVVITRDSGDVIGWCKLDIDDTEAELGYWIGESHQRKGYALELSQGAIAFAFETLRLRSVKAGAQVSNAASLALIRKLGMSRDGVESVWAPARQQFEDCEFWRLERKE